MGGGAQVGHCVRGYAVGGFAVGDVGQRRDVSTFVGDFHGYVVGGARCQVGQRVVLNISSWCGYGGVGDQRGVFKVVGGDEGRVVADLVVGGGVVVAVVFSGGPLDRQLGL